MASYRTRATWKGGHRGELECGNGAVLPFSAPAGLLGEAGVLTPEDAFVGALNGCFMLMFLWACERMKIRLVAYESEAVGEVEERLDRTSVFRRVTLKPRITVKDDQERVRRALGLAEKYSLIWQSVRAEVVLEPEIVTT